MAMQLLDSIVPMNERSGILYDTVLGESIDAALRGKKFLLLEHFCDSIKCDCKSTVIGVEEIKMPDATDEPNYSQPPLAVIRYDWSQIPPEIILDEESEQSSFASTMLTKYKQLTENKEYTSRLTLKYKLFKAWCLINELLPMEANPKLGRNDLCVCGSGKKYKKCCLIRNKKNTVSRSLVMEDG